MTDLGGLVYFLRSLLAPVGCWVGAVCFSSVNKTDMGNELPHFSLANSFFNKEGAFSKVAVCSCSQHYCPWPPLTQWANLNTNTRYTHGIFFSVCHSSTLNRPTHFIKTILISAWCWFENVLKNSSIYLFVVRLILIAHKEVYFLQSLPFFLVERNTFNYAGEKISTYIVDFTFS